MKKQLLTLIFINILFILFLYNCGSRSEKILKEYSAELEIAYKKAGENLVELKKAIAIATPEELVGVVFLIANMPERDLTSLSADFILHHTNWAYKVKKEFTWAKSVPDSIFLNNVLPYICANETRDEWREALYNKFSSLVKDCQTVTQVIDSININIPKVLGVDYNVKRPKCEMSPMESLEYKMATCTGLSILLVEAFRSVGIPSRFAGVPRWHNNSGNHSWAEVWIDGEWYFTEYYPSGLNKGWLLPLVGKADVNDPMQNVYAQSFKKTGTYFPLVWDSLASYVPAYIVTQRYMEINNALEKDKADTTKTINIEVMIYKSKKNIDAADRIKQEIKIVKGRDEIAIGTTSGPLEDLNNILNFDLKKNTKYTIHYFKKNKKPAMHEFTTPFENLRIKLYTVKE